MLCPHCGKTFVHDPTGLLASEEPVAPLGDLAKLVGLPKKKLNSLLSRKLYKSVRFIHAADGTKLYCIADTHKALEPILADLLAQRAENLKNEEARKIAGAARRAAKLAAAPPPPAKASKKPTGR